MGEHRYILEPYKGMNTRYCCPSCQQRYKTFSRYIDTETGEHIHPSVGRCNRESKCGYHYTPGQYFRDNNIQFERSQPKDYANAKAVALKQKPVTYIPPDVFKASLKGYSDNYFVQYCARLFGAKVTSELISRYFIASSKHWQGATVFWQIDVTGKIRTGKIMLYNPSTGKRVKEPYNHITWVHKATTQPDFELRQCYFGEHLLKDRMKPVAIVEGEKTAIIASVYLPQFTWLAAGSLSNLSADKCGVLKGRIITLFPDLNGFDKWNNKVKELSHLTRFNISDLLERKATEAERKQGLDLADYLIRFDFREFRTPQPEPIAEPEPIYPPQATKTIVEVNQPEPMERDYHRNAKPESWEQDISALETFFADTPLPSQPVQVNKWSTITDCRRFIETNLAIVRANNGKRTYLPYLHGLEELKQKLSSEGN